MDANKNTAIKKEQKQWENPVEPTKTSDARDEEQILRQYNEAKRRKDNLSEEEDKKNKDIYNIKTKL